MPQIIPASYSNESRRVFIADVPDKIVAASPEGIHIPVPPSGIVTPFSGLGSPAAGTRTGTPTIEGDGGLPLRKSVHPSK